MALSTNWTSAPRQRTYQESSRQTPGSTSDASTVALKDETVPIGGDSASGNVGSNTSDGRLPAELWLMVSDYLSEAPEDKQAMLSLQTVCKTTRDATKAKFAEMFPPIWKVIQEISTGRLWSRTSCSPDDSKTISSLLIQPWYAEEQESYRAAQSDENLLSGPQNFARFTTVVIVPSTLMDLGRALDPASYGRNFRKLVGKCESIEKFVVDGREMKMGSTGGNLHRSTRFSTMNSILSVIGSRLTKVVVRVKDVSLHSLLPTVIPGTVTTIHLVFSGLQVDGKATWLAIQDSVNVLSQTFFENEKPKLHLETTGESAYTEYDIQNLHRSIFDILGSSAYFEALDADYSACRDKLVLAMNRISTSFAVTKNAEQSDVIPERCEIYRDWYKTAPNSVAFFQSVWNPDMFGSTPSDIFRFRSD